MANVFGFQFRSTGAAVAFAAIAAVLALIFMHLVQSSIRHHPDATQRAVREHCRHLTGKQIAQLPPDEFTARMERCNAFRIRTVDAAGGVLDPVMVRITLEPGTEFPLEGRSYIFKSALVGFAFSASLAGLTSGHWEFNYYNTYSDTTFRYNF